MKRAFLTSVAAALLGGLLAAASPAQSVWEMTPYRVRLIVAVAPSLPGAAGLQSDLAQGLVERIDVVVGVLWDASAQAPDARLRHRITTGLESLRMEDLPKDCVKYDKVFCVAVTPGATGYEVAARELDVRSQVFGPVQRFDALQVCKLRDVIMRALVQVFTPLANVVESQAREATLRLRGGKLPTREIQLQVLKPGDVLQPLIRYNAREGNVRKIVPVPWTFLVVDQFDPTRFHCVIHSALFNPLSGRLRGRVEQLALLVRPLGDSTRLVITSREAPQEPLAGYLIYTQPPDSKKTTLLGQTDLAGSITLVRGDDLLRRIIVKSGKKLLARLPIVPGLEPELTAGIPRDTERLEAEGYTIGVQDDLIDLVTRRRILIEKGEKAISEGDLKEASRLLAELRSLPTPNEMLRQLGLAQRRFATDNPRTAKKIDELFEETRKLIDRFLDKGPIDDLDRQWRAARDGKRPAPAAGATPSGAPPAGAPAATPPPTAVSPPAAPPAGVQTSASR